MTFDCESCGLCCAPPPGTTLSMPLRDADMDLLTPELEELMEEEGDRILIMFDNIEVPKYEARILGWSLNSKLEKIRVTKCPHLRGVVGMIVSCEIYEKRPKVCSDVRSRRLLALLSIAPTLRMRSESRVAWSRRWRLVGRRWLLIGVWGTPTVSGAWC